MTEHSCNMDRIMLLLKLEQDFWLKVFQIFISGWEILTYVLFVTVFSEVKIENISDKLLHLHFFPPFLNTRTYDP